MKYAVIDLSSTGVSMVIADGGDGTFNVVYKDRVNIAITDYFEGRSISARGIEKLIDAIITERATAKAMCVDKCYVISTAVLRNVDNIAAVAEKIRLRTGMVINHLDGNTEAYCDLVSNRKYSAYDKAILIDIGGNSVELCDFSKDSKSEMVCLEFGPIKLKNKYVDDIYPTEDEAKSIRKFLRKKSNDAELAGKHKFRTAVLVGSINEAICAAYREYCEKKKLGTEFIYDRFKKFVDMLLTSSDRTRLIMKVAPEKINILPVAALILKEMLKRFKPDNIIISDSGVKEGYLMLVASGEESGVSADLSAPMPTYEPVEPPKQKKKADEKSPSAKADGKAEGKKPAAKRSAGKKSGSIKKQSGEEVKTDVKE